MADPELTESYGPGAFWSNSYVAHPETYPMNELLIPMDSRTAASFTGTGDYFWDRVGGWSWPIPYIAGLYALACQVKPDITPEVFWDAALRTGTALTVTHSGNVYELGRIINPPKLIDELSS